MVVPARFLDNTFRGAIYGNDMPDEHSTGRKRPNSEMDVIKRLNEAMKDKDDMGMTDPVVIELNKSHCKNLVRKARDLMEQ